MVKYVLSIFQGLGLILYYVFDGISPPSERDAIGTARNFPLFFGTTLFALEAVGVVSIRIKFKRRIIGNNKFSFIGNCCGK